MDRNDIIDKAVQYIINTDQTPYKIANATSISRMAIGNYKKGKSRPTLANANTIVDYFEKGIQTRKGESENFSIIDGDCKKVICNRYLISAFVLEME